MKFKFGDLIWIIILLMFILVLIFEESRLIYIELTTNHPYFMGFVKTAILATMGELLAVRIVTKKYKGIGVLYKFIVWGILGMAFVLVFKIFAGGVLISQQANLLPNITDDTYLSNLLHAFLTSLIMNLIFAPTFMCLHRITDGYIELGEGKLKNIMNVNIDSIIDRINWHSFIKFVVFTTIPLFWVPAHTITFLLPEQYRVLMAAFLSIALGIILSLAKRKKV